MKLYFHFCSVVSTFRLLNTLDVGDPLARAKWMNVKKALMEETEVVKQLDAEKRAFKETPLGRRPPSPPISTKSSFVFQPLDEYPTSSGAPMDDPDVWRPPTRDNANRRTARAGQVGMRKSPQDATWARGATRGGASGRGAKAAGSSKSNTGVRASTTGKKGSGSAKSSKADSVVILYLSNAISATVPRCLVYCVLVCKLVLFYLSLLFIILCLQLVAL